MDKRRSNESKSNSAIRNKKYSKLQNKDYEINPRNVIKKRGVYVEKISDCAMEPNRTEQVFVKPGSNKKLLESALTILTKSSKATQWPDQKKIRKNNQKWKNDDNEMRLINKKVEDNKRRPIVLIPNNAVRVAVAKRKYAPGKSPLGIPKNPADETLATKHNVTIKKTTPTKHTKATVNTTVAKSKDVSKTAPKTNPEIRIEQIVKPKFATRKVKRLLHRKASPDNTLISDKIIKKETPKDIFNDIETESEDKLCNMHHDDKIYSLINDFLENAINTCSDHLSENSDSDLHIDKDVALKLMMKSDIDKDDSEHSLLSCPDTNDSSSTTIRRYIENNISRGAKKSQSTRKVNAECMAEVRNEVEENVISKKRSKNITKNVIVANKLGSLAQPKQKIQRKATPMPKFVTKSDYLVQHIYNIHLNSHTLKTKKFELVKQLKNSSTLQKPQNFFDTLSLIMRNKNFKNTQNIKDKYRKSQFLNIKNLTKTKTLKFVT